jgi:hypothetical protein
MKDFCIEELKAPQPEGLPGSVSYVLLAGIHSILLPYF